MANDSIEITILKILIDHGILNESLIPEIKEKMDIGLTLGEVLIGDNYVNQEGFIALLAELYRKKMTNLDLHS